MIQEPRPQSWLEAARIVLRRHGRPLHYTTIADAAFKMRLLPCETLNPRQMSIALSADIRKTAGSDFRRVRPGVYELAEHTNTGSPIGSYHSLGHRVRDLTTSLAMSRVEPVLNRALWVTRQCLTLAAGSDQITVDMLSISLDPPNICTRALAYWRKSNPHRHDHRPLTLTRNLTSGYRTLAQVLRVNVRTAVAFAVSVLETLLTMTHRSTLEVTGQDGTSRDILLR